MSLKDPSAAVIFDGLAIGACLHPLGVFGWAFVFPPAILFIGVTQLAYMLPALFIARLYGVTSGTMKGLVLTITLPFLLNGLCLAAVFGSQALSGMGK